MPAALLALVLVAGALGPAGGATGGPAQAPNLQGAFIVGNGAALAMVGYVGWANVWTPAGNGSQIYSQAVYIYFFNLHGFNETLDIGVRQSTGYEQNETVVLPGVSQVSVTLQVPPDANWVTTVLSFDGVDYWVGQMATPVSLFPSFLVNLGGTDLFALAIVSFMLVVVVGAFAAGRWAIKRAIWAPRFSLLIWGHVVLAAIAGAVFVDFQAIDSFFAGWSPLVYPWLVFPLAFTTALSYFNRSHKVELLQGLVTGSGEMGYRRTEVRVGRLPDGRLALVGESWGQFWARFWRHYPIIDDGKEDHARPFLAPVVTAVSPTANPRARMKSRKRALVQRPTAADALTAFPVLNPTTDVAYVGWVAGSEPIRVEWPRLSVHKVVTLPPRYVPSARDGAGPVLLPERKARRLTWPHYVDPARAPIVELEDRHYAPAAAVWAGFATIRDLGRVSSKLALRVEALAARTEQTIQDEVYSRLRTHYALVGRATSGISDEEAAESVRRVNELTGGGPAPGRE